MCYTQHYEILLITKFLQLFDLNLWNFALHRIFKSKIPDIYAFYYNVLHFCSIKEQTKIYKIFEPNFLRILRCMVRLRTKNARHIYIYIQRNNKKCHCEISRYASYYLHPCSRYELKSMKYMKLLLRIASIASTASSIWTMNYKWTYLWSPSIGLAA